MNHEPNYPLLTTLMSNAKDFPDGKLTNNTFGKDGYLSAGWQRTFTNLQQMCRATEGQDYSPLTHSCHHRRPPRNRWHPSSCYPQDHQGETFGRPTTNVSRYRLLIVNYNLSYLEGQVFQAQGHIFPKQFCTFFSIIYIGHDCTYYITHQAPRYSLTVSRIIT